MAPWPQSGRDDHVKVQASAAAAASINMLEVRMPSYKVDVVKRFGKLHFALWVATEARPDLLKSKAYEDVDELLADARKAAGKLGPGDSIIFRQIAYDDRGELFSEMKRAEY